MTDEYFRDQTPDGFGEEFHLHAAPEAIQASILEWVAKERKARETLGWLRELQAHRATQVMRGEWPAARANSEPAEPEPLPRVLYAREVDPSTQHP